MIWAGRLNSIIFIAAAVFIGLFWLLAQFGPSSDIGVIGCVLTAGIAVIVRVAFSFIDIFWRATKGRPFIYNTLVEFDKQLGARIS